MSSESAKEESSPVWNLGSLAPRKGARHRRKRIGFGESSGKGKTCGHGYKGQKSRSGYSRKRGFEGGQMPLHRRLPKVGFTSRKRVRGENTFVVVSLQRLSKAEATGEVTLDRLVELGLLRTNKERVKILGPGEVKGKLIVDAHAISASARELIEKAGGEVRLV